MGSVPVAVYGMVLLFSAIAYTILNRELACNHEGGTALARSAGSGLKGTLSIVCYVAAIAPAFVNPWISCALYVLVALSWFIPDRGIESVLAS
ncbi:MAG: hypothetical protein JSR95_19485 [Proteobacteria bacterium]|nr:hypothetical protein [Pseudomonadota bacterium]